MTLSSRSIPSFVLAAFVFSICWLLPNHHWPWVDFYSDAWASLTLWVVALVILWKSRDLEKIEINEISLLTLAFLLIIIFQYVSGLINEFGQAWVSFFYVLGFFLALLVGGRWERWKPQQCSDFLFIASLLGAAGSLLIQFQQWLQINPGEFFWLFVPSPSRRFHANLGQPNQLATLICMGVLACVWLYERKWLNGWLAWVWAVMLAIGLVLAESRTSWLVIAGCLGAMVFWRKQLKIKNQLIFAAILWILIFLMLMAVLPHVNLWLGRTSELQDVRDISSNEARLIYWGKLLQAILAHPWVGYGWMQTSYAQLTVDPYEMLTGGTFRHAHNLILDFFTWMGIPLGIFSCLVLFMFFYKVVIRIKEREQLWMLLFVFSLMVHALLEYPLYYAYFLLPLGLMLGVISSVFQIKYKIYINRSATFFALIIAGVGWGVTVYDYVPVEENFFALRFEHQRLAKQGEFKEPEVIALTQLKDAVWLARVDPSSNHSELDLNRALKVTKLLPSVVNQYKMASMYALAGDYEKSQYWIIVMTRMNSIKKSSVNEIRRQWDEQAIQYPAMAKVKWPE